MNNGGIFKQTEILENPIIQFALKNWPYLILSLVYWLAVLPNITNKFFDFGGDSCQYIILAENIVKGIGYRMTNYPGNPICFLYPPVFPLLLSFVVKFFGRNFYLMYLLIAFLGFLGLMFSYRIFKKYSSRKIAFFAALLLCLNCDYIMYSARFIRSEIPCLFFCGAALLALARYMKSKTWLNPEGVMFTGLLVLSYFTRHSGIALFLGVMFSLVFSKSQEKFKKIFFSAGIFLLFFLAWNIFHNLYKVQTVSQFNLLFAMDIYAPDKGTLWQHPVYFLFRFIDGVNYYAGIVSHSIFPYFSKYNEDFRVVLLITVMAVVFYGFWKQFKANKGCVFSYYFILMLLLAVFWPAKEDIRFILPILPFFIFYLVIGLKNIFIFLPAGANRLTFYCLMIIFALLSCSCLKNSSAYSIDSLPPELKNFLAANYWIKDNVFGKAVILSRKPTVTFFYTGCQSLVYPYENTDSIKKFVEDNKVGYILVDNFSQTTTMYLFPFLNKYHNCFNLVYKSGNTGVLKVISKLE